MIIVGLRVFGLYTAPEVSVRDEDADLKVGGVLCCGMLCITTLHTMLDGRKELNSIIIITTVTIRIRIAVVSTPKVILSVRSIIQKNIA